MYVDVEGLGCQHFILGHMLSGHHAPNNIKRLRQVGQAFSPLHHRHPKRYRSILYARPCTCVLAFALSVTFGFSFHRGAYNLFAIPLKQVVILVD